MGIRAGRMSQQRTAAILGILISAAVGFGIWAYYRAPPDSETIRPAETSATVGSTDSSKSPEHPIGRLAEGLAEPTTAALPPLHQSDLSVAESLVSLVGNDQLLPVLVDTAIIPRVVATVDALPRKELAARNLPLVPAQGRLETMQVGGRTVIAPANRQRFAPYMQLMAGVDTDAVVSWYVRHYPLFQRAYEDLGYPDGYFNDRLIEVIDHLLETPNVPAEPAVVPHKGVWIYADPRLESLSTGQKLLLRIGPEYAATVKSRLRELRAGLVASAPASGNSSGSQGSPVD